MFTQSINWQSPASHSIQTLPDTTKSWLLESNSMTQRMEQCCHSVQIKVISHHLNLPTKEEAFKLEMPLRHYASIREIYMLCNKDYWLFGRTVIPLGTMRGKWRRLRGFGKLPLGKLLFSDPTVRRSEFEIAQIKMNSDEYIKIAKKRNLKSETSWARRSTFDIQGQPLLLTEIFLAAMIKGITS